eukprot:6703675-Prymnesium_polylepis.1
MAYTVTMAPRKAPSAPTADPCTTESASWSSSAMPAMNPAAPQRISGWTWLERTLRSQHKRKVPKAKATRPTPDATSSTELVGTDSLEECAAPDASITPLSSGSIFQSC